MSARSNFESDYTATVRAGRANVRLIEAAEVLIGLEEHAPSRRALERMRRRYQKALRQLTERLPLHVSAQIFAASEMMLGPIGDVGAN